MSNLSLTRSAHGPAASDRAGGRGGEVVDAYPLTPMQQAMLLHSRRDPRAGLYVQQYVCTLREPLHLPEFRSAWQRLALRHPVLRTSFHLDSTPEPLQRVHPEVEVPWRESDLRDVPEEVQEEAIQAFLREDRSTPLPLEDAPLARFTLFRLGDAAYRLVWTSHHALIDSHARRILLQEVFEDYEASVDGRDPARTERRPYGEYVRWLRHAEPPGSPEFWEEELRGFEAPNEVVLEGDRGEREDRERHGFELSEELTDALRHLARREAVTLNTVLQGAWALLLGRYAGDTDVVFGATRMCRTTGFAGARDVVGLLSNTVPVRVRLDMERTAADHLRGVRAGWVRMRPHERTHLSRIQEWSEVPAGTPLFQTVFGFETEPVQDQLHRLGGGWQRRTFDLLQRVGYPLTVIARGGARVSVEMLHDPRRFGRDAIRRMGEHFTLVLQAFAEDPEQPLGSVGILSPAERRHLVEELNPPLTPDPASACIHGLLQAQAARTPEAVAVVFQGDALTYAELERRSNQLAHALRRRGVGPEARVGVCMERSLELVIALAAILKAGGAYVPLDPQNPRDRLRFVLEDAGVSHLLCQAHLEERLPAGGPDRMVADPLWAQAAGESAGPVEVRVEPHGLAYVMYTSGSTGTPKGVGVEHRGVVRLVRGADYAEFGPREVVLQAAPVSFDASTLELWGALLNGARLVLMPGAAPSLEELGGELRRHGVTTLWLTAGLFQVMVEEQLEALGGVRQLITGGDVVPPAQVEKARERFPLLRLINGYGPTENTTFTCCYTVPADWSGGPLPIGRPIAGTRVYVLDDTLQPVPVGVPGELYAGGAGVARGYLGRPGQTAERFVPDPFRDEPGARMYRTGDRVRWRSDGTMEFLGRLDGQVKIRGLRIELGEIEAVLRRYAGECVVVAREDVPGERRVVAYVVGEVDAEALRSSLRKNLPDYMVPGAFVALPRLPLTPNGKLDREALPAPEYGGAGERHVAPRTPVEEVLAGIWAEVLGLETVGMEASFIELGGHSLLAMRLLSRVREAFGVELPMHTLLDGSTVAGVAERVEEIRRAELPVLPPVVPVERTASPPLSFAQERLWFLDRLTSTRALYNIPVAYRLGGAPDVEALERALGEVVRRHEALRTVFREVEGSLAQVIAPFRAFALPVEDLSDLSEADREAALGQRVREEAARPFDLSAGPLFRAKLLRLGARDHVLLLSMHHIVSDGWSMGVLFRELAALYGAYREGRESPLPELAVQYADYAAWHREQLAGETLERQLAYWRERLAGAPELLNLSTDHPRPPVQTHRGAHERIDMSGELPGRLRALGRSEGATLYMVLLGAFQVLLSRYTREEDVVVGSPVAGRTRRELEELIGYFANTLVLRTDLGGNPGFREVLRRVRAATLGAYEHQDVPFERVVAELQPERSLSHSPLFQVTLTLQDAEAPGVSLPGLSVRAVETEATAAKFDLLLSVEATSHGLRAGLTYATDLFERATIRRMLGHLERVLEQVAGDPDARLSDLKLMAESERAQLVEEWTRNRVEFPPGRSIQGRFEAQVERTPDAVAVVCGDAALTYRELNARANRLARRLRALGVGPESRVGIVLERSAELVVAILATLKAGGAYVPLDPDYPAERIAFVLEDAAVPVLVTTGALLPRLPSFGGAALRIDSDADAIAAESGENPEGEAAPDVLAYVIYTSGSTGRPKGVQVTHANVGRLFDATRAWFGFGEDDVWTLFHSCTFDFSVWELWGALLYGGRLVVVPFLVTRSPDDFHRLVVDQGVTVLSQTPSAFKQFVQADLGSGVDPSALRLRHVVFGGEALDPQALRPWFERHGDGRPRLVNMYGITETTVHVTYRPITRADLDRPGSPIGVPIPDLALYVLDARLEPVPPGVPGEIFVGGAGVARGYLNRPGLTAERFVQDPFSGGPGARLYRSGDLARWRPDGELEYLGRADQQVKVRGFRIETGEIEALLASHPAVADVAVVAREDGAGERRLVAYVVAAPGVPGPTPAELRARLAEALPDYMVPAAFVPLDRLPLTGNGKLDRRALPAPEEAHAATAAGAYAPPRTAAEKVLAEAWREVLGVERVGIDDNYFALGGDSIRSVRLVAAARRGGLSLSIPQLYQHQTVRGLAARAELSDGARVLPEASAAAFALLDPAARDGLPEDVEDAYPASQVQLGMLYHTERDPASLVYHEVLSYRVHTRFDEAAMREALRRVAERHPLLRTSFDLAARPEPIQRVHRRVEIPLEVEDFRHPDAAGSDAWMEREKGRGFDWTVAPLLRFRVHLLPDDAFRVVLVEHHVVLDGWSVASLMTELLRLFVALRDGLEDPTGAPPAARFRDFVALERQAVASEESRAFWRRVLDGAPDRALPPREGDDAPPEEEAPFLWIDLPAEVADGLGRVAARAGVPLKTVLLAAHLRVLALLSGSDEVVTGYVTSGRPESDGGERVLGVFLNTVPLRVAMAGGTWLDLVRRTWAAEEALLPHRRFPLSEIVREAGGRTPFESAFNFIHFHVYDALAACGVRLVGDRFFQKTEVPLLANALMSTVTGGLRLRLEYDPARLADAQVRALGGWYGRALTALGSRPEAPWEADGLLSEEEAARLRQLGAGAVVDYPRCTLHALVEAQAGRTPGAVAVVHEEASLTYAELNARANRLAHHLVRLGVGPEVRVGVCLERGPELVVSLLAVLKAGGAYVPLDPAYPAERLRLTLADAGAAVLVTQEKLRGLLRAHAGPTVEVDLARAEIAAGSDSDPVGGATPRNLAYLIYTSGSTGVPKGVAIEHESAVAMLAWAWSVYSAEELSGVLASTSICFDMSVFELFAPLGRGGRAIVVENALALPTSRAAGEVRLVDTVPSAMAALLRSGGIPPGVKTVNLGGEPLRADLVDGLYARGVERVYDLYGPSEDTTFSTWELRRPGGPTTIGRVLSNSHAYVLDPGMRPVPVGVVGELYLGGRGVTRGYLGRPGLTAGRYLPDPFSAEPGARMYRTGDRIRWRADGTLEYLGRLDEQVKIRGFRVEVGEVEAVLRRHPGVADCAVVARDGEPGERRLVAYVVGEAEGLRAHARRVLPEHMVPSVFVPLDALPLTPNGKLDRRALPDPLAAVDRDGFLGPRDSLELRLAQLWEELLGVRPVGVRDDFFALGGHSLLALRLLPEVERLTGRRVPMGTLLTEPTVERLARVLRGEALPAAGPLVPIQPEGRERPLFLVHAAGGNVVSYAALARHLGPYQPLYGLQSRGLEDEEPSPVRVEELAADYLAQLRTVQEEGPYRLGGWSMGGLVAFEMARMLTAAGEEVEVLALVDCRAPRDDSPPLDPDAPGLLAGFMLHLGLPPERIPPLAEEVPAPGPGQRLRRAWEAARAADAVPADLDLARFERLWTVFRANASAAAAYRPGTCASDLLLVFAEDRPAPAASEAARWEALTAGTVRTAVVPGDHFTLVREPYVAELAALLADALAPAQAGGGRAAG